MRAANRRPPRGRESGFVLVEILISMLLVSIAVLALGVMLVRISRTAGASATSVYQAAALAAEASRINALPFDSLATLAPGCVTVTAAPQPYQRCTTVNNVSSKVKSVIIVVTPSGNALLHPDTIIVVRTRSSGQGNPRPGFP